MWIPESTPGATNFSKKLVKTLGTLNLMMAGGKGGRRVKRSLP